MEKFMQQQLQADLNRIFESGKTYTHSQGLSTAFRQWRAESHCRFLHGYALQVKVIFRNQNLDHRNWVQDFGSLKPLKEWLAETFDHKTLVAKDDPNLESFRTIAHFKDPLIQLVEVDHIGCEAFAKMIFDWVFANISPNVHWVEVREHEGNHGGYGNP